MKLVHALRGQAGHCLEWWYRVKGADGWHGFEVSTEYTQLCVLSGLSRALLTQVHSLRVLLTLMISTHTFLCIYHSSIIFLFALVLRIKLRPHAYQANTPSLNSISSPYNFFKVIVNIKNLGNVILKKKR